MEKAVREWPFPDSSCTRTGGPGSCFSPRTRGQNMKLAARKKLSPLPHTSLLQDALGAKSSCLQNISEQKQTLPGGTRHKLFGAWAVLGRGVPGTHTHLQTSLLRAFAFLQTSAFSHCWKKPPGAGPSHSSSIDIIMPTFFTSHSSRCCSCVTSHL